MTDHLLTTLAGVTTLTLMGGLGLFAFKYLRHRYERFAEFRRAAYVGAISELATRAGYPPTILRRWAEDPVFLETLVEFLRFLRGTERDNLLRLSQELRVVDGYLGALRHSRRRRRRVMASEALAEFADPATMDALLTALDDPVRAVRWNAAMALAKIGDERAVPGLVRTLEKSRDWGADRIADALVEFGHTAVNHLARYLLLSLPDIEGESHHLPLMVRVLGVIGDVRAEPALLATLASPDLEVRIRSAAALGSAGTPQCVPALIRALRDPQWEVRAQAAGALGKQLDPRAIEPLQEAMCDPNWWVRQNAAEALSRIPSGEAALVDVLLSDDPFARDAAVERLLSAGVVRRAVAEGEASGPGSVPWLLIDRFRRLGLAHHLGEPASSTETRKAAG